MASSRKLITPEQRKEKRATHTRLCEYYSANGLGSFVPLAKAYGVDICILHGMMQAEPYPYEIWKKVKRGLDKICPTQTPPLQSAPATA